MFSIISRDRAGQKRFTQLYRRDACQACALSLRRQLGFTDFTTAEKS
jgi:hypothetical protein